MTLLFGQFPQASYAAGQFVLHALVGSVGDIPPTPPPPTPNMPSYGGGWTSAKNPVFIRREEILAVPPKIEEDLILGIAVLLLLETENSS